MNDESTAEKFLFLAKELMPHQDTLHSLPTNILEAPEEKQSNLIDEHFFRRSEYLGGMAAVLLALADRAE